MTPSSPPSLPAAAHAALRQRIDDELAQLAPVEVSSWMTALPETQEDWGDGRPGAGELELDAALGSLFWQARAHLAPGHCVQVLGPDGTLVAVRQAKTGLLFVRLWVALADLNGLALHRRPSAAGAAPQGYRQTNLSAALWRFAQFGKDGDRALPAASHTAPLRLGVLPPVDRSLVAVRHVKMMRMLQERPHTFAELLYRSGLSETQLTRDLAALLLVGSLIVD